MLKIIEFLDTSKVSLIGEMAELSPIVEDEIERLWQEEQRRRKASLFNGKILSATSVSSQEILGVAVEYRHLIAQRARPELYEFLRVRPVAVSGLLECADGFIFGKRGGSVSQDSGLWELAPSGGLDLSTTRVGQEIDCRAQILTELHEEIGLKADAMTSTRTFCMIEDQHSHVLDIGISMKSTLSGSTILEAHRKGGSQEYEKLHIIPRAELSTLINDAAHSLVGVSRELLEYYLRRVPSPSI